jgi:hypothetical protein
VLHIDFYFSSDPGIFRSAISVCLIINIFRLYLPAILFCLSVFFFELVRNYILGLFLTIGGNQALKGCPAFSKGESGIDNRFSCVTIYTSDYL